MCFLFMSSFNDCHPSAQVNNSAIAVAEFFGLRSFDDCAVDQREIVIRCEVENCTLSEMLIEV
jgi:hypothetical protein